LKNKIIAVFLFLCSISSISLLFEEHNFIYLILAVACAFGGIKLFNSTKGNKKSSPIKTKPIVAKTTITEPPKYNTPLEKSNKKYYTFKVAGVTKRNDEGDNIQYLISEYVKEQLEFIDAYDGLKNREILEEYYDDRVYEISDLFLNKNEIRLVFEPDNPYDPNAIKIISEFMGHIGYVPKDDNIKVSEIIKNKNYNITAQIIGGKYKYVDQDEDKINIENDNYGVEVEISYE